MFSGGQCWICSGAVVVYDEYAHVYYRLGKPWKAVSGTDDRTF